MRYLNAMRLLSVVTFQAKKKFFRIGSATLGAATTVHTGKGGFLNGRLVLVEYL